MGLLRETVCRELSTIVSIGAILIYHALFKKGDVCTCEKGRDYCAPYMVLPYLLIFFCKLLMDTGFWKVSRYCCACLYPLSKSDAGYHPPGYEACGYFQRLIINHIIQALHVSGLWVAAVYIDGDWFVCCWDSSIMCSTKPFENLIDAAQKNAELRNVSKTIGFSLLLYLIIVTFVTRFLYWRKCCCYSSRSCHTKYEYDLLILEEERDVIEETLRERAKQALLEKITEKLNLGQWDKCDNVADTVIATLHHPRPVNMRDGGENQATGEDEMQLI